MKWTQHLNADPVHPDIAVSAPPDADAVRLDQLTLTELVLPEQSNHYGTLFGPNGLALLGKAAYLVATRYTRQAVVMAGATRIEFLRPVPVGAILKIHAQIVRVGMTSMTARISANFDAAPGTRVEGVLRGDFEMVTVDEHGRPVAVSAPHLNPEQLTEQTLAAARG